MRTTLPIRLTLAVLAASALPRTASAESAAPACSPGEAHPSGGDIPANLSTFVLANGLYPFGDPTPTAQLFERVGAGLEERALDIARDGSAGRERWFLTPTEPLVEGATYELFDNTCSGFSGQWTYQVGPAVPLPTTLGVTTVSELRATRSDPRDRLQRYVRVRLELSPEARAARALYESQRLVDEVSLGAFWAPLDDNDVRVPVDCDGLNERSVHPGIRRFEHHARLYGEAPSLFTTPVDRAIDCDDAVRVDPFDEHPLNPAEIEEMDRVPFDASPPALDAGPRDGGPRDGGATSGMSGGGCSCRAARGGAPPSWPALGLMALAMSRLTRRRARGR